MRRSTPAITSLDANVWPLQCREIDEPGRFQRRLKLARNSAIILIFNFPEDDFGTTSGRQTRQSLYCSGLLTAWPSRFAVFLELVELGGEGRLMAGGKSWGALPGYKPRGPFPWQFMIISTANQLAAPASKPKLKALGKSIRKLINEPKRKPSCSKGRESVTGQPRGVFQCFR